MFGNPAVTSTWSNPQQNQPGGSAFGQPSTFGTGGAFSSGNTFGQSSQPQANPMFGNLAPNPNPNPSTGTGGFGAFGNNPPQASTGNTLFGGAKPATGFGAFTGGTGTSTFGGGGTFGGNTGGSTNVFGQPANTSGFGANAGSNLFNKPHTGFGGAQPNTSGGAFDTSAAPVSTGSANPPFAVFTEKDNQNTLQYQSISCMPQYRGSSHEELRLQDYAQGRRTAGAFGQSTAFGPNPTTAPTNIFGAPTQQPPANPLFGGTANTGTNAFGTFGQNNTSQPAAGAGIFGSFGQQQQQQQQQPATGFNAFNQNAQQPQTQTGTGLFGGGAFGKPSAFGTFGGGNTFGGGAFGTQPQQTQPASTGLFGQQPQAQPNNAISGFGANANVNKPVFGTQPPAPTNPGFGAFGQQQGQQQQQPGSGLFGGNSLFNNNQQSQLQPPSQPNQATSGLFGNAQPTQPNAFGAGSLFGNNTTQQPNTQQPQNNFSNLFSKPANAPTSTGIFGNFGTQGSGLNNLTAQGQQGSALGNPLGNQQQPSGAFNNLFGKPTAPVMGQSQSTMGQSGGGGLGGSLWGNSYGSGSLNLTANAPGAQGTLTASITQPIGTNLPIFSMLPPGPRAIPLDLPKKKPGFFVDIPTRSPIPRLQLGYTPANSKLRGFSASTSLAPNKDPFAGTSLTSGKANVLSLSRAVDTKAPAGPGFVLGHGSSPSLGGGGRQSVKKLVLDKKVDPSDFFGTHKLGGSKITFSPALSIAAREKDAADAAAAASTTSPLPNESPTPAPRNPRTGNRFTAKSTQNATDKKAEKEGELREGEYWVKPDIETLRNAGYDELVSFKELVIGRVGYGEIHFLETVDLTGLPKLGALLGQIVRFDDKECSVYPDLEEVDKPPPGSGLNVRARVILIRCWTQDKATREPIKDEKNPLAIRHLKRLKAMKDTHFESWDMETGRWTFTVDHF